MKSSKLINNLFDRHLLKLPLLIHYVLGFVILHQERKRSKRERKKQKGNPKLILPTKFPKHFMCWLMMVVVFRGWGWGKNSSCNPTISWAEFHSNVVARSCCTAPLAVVALTTYAIAATAAASKLTTAKAPVPRASQLFWLYCFIYASPAHKNTLQKFLIHHNKYMHMTSRLIPYWFCPLKWHP